MQSSVDTSRSVRPQWTRIATIRRRDVLVIGPLSVVAMLGCSIWLGLPLATLWLGVTAALIVVSLLLCLRIERLPSPGPSDEALLAVFSFVYTGVYVSLPVALATTGQPFAIVAGAAMVGGVAISSTLEFIHSRLIGGACILATFIGCVAASILLDWHGRPVELIVALVAVFGFYGYVLLQALSGERSERALKTALQAAEAGASSAEQASRAKSAFLATMSHEIRTPLNGVIGMVQAMTLDDLSPLQRERLTIVRQSGEALTAILNDVLDLAKIEAGHLTLQSDSFDLAGCLRPCVETFRAIAAEKGLCLRLEISPSAAGLHQGDEARIRQVIANLVSNAVKFTSEGEVSVTAESLEGLLTISVRDTGPGIAPEAAQRLFSDFVQLDSGMTRIHGGTGLGLAICRRLCDIMGGEISLTSQAGEGSTFTVALPTLRIAGATASLDESTVADTPAEPDAQLRVLAAEDNKVNQLVLTALLAQAGITPVIVDNGAKAIEAWQASDWDIILMDVQMPVMDGLSATREIRRLETLEGRRRTPIVGLSANSMTHQIAEVRAAGMDEHVAKPIEVARLFAVLSAIVGADQADEDSEVCVIAARR
jgi:two-component system, sensor histidine kinase